MSGFDERTPGDRLPARGNTEPSPSARHDADAEALAYPLSFYERLLTLVERAGDIVWTVDLGMNPTYVSGSILQHLGYSPQEAMRMSMAEMFTPESFRQAMTVLGDELARDAVTPDRTRILEFDLRHRDGYAVPFEICYSALRDASGRPVEILAVARNITTRRRAEQEEHARIDRVNQAMRQTLGALGVLVEARDPHAAGHQRRVAYLACAIARRLGLPDACIEGLWLAGLIHDVGKVGIPEEIVSARRPLSAAEAGLVQTHPAIAYQALKGVSFPWPVAEAVHQHHERLDGSGYPLGLRGDEIIIEARVLAVADVVETLASNRGCDAVGGIEAALAHIATQRGRLYDALVVDACLEVFRKEDYRLEDLGL